MSPFNLEGSTTGATLFETLMVLAILAGVAGITASAIRTPSPQLILRQEAQSLRTTVIAAREAAVRSGRPQSIENVADDCSGQPARLVAFADGTILSPDLCLTLEGETIRLAVDNITGRLKIEAVD